MKLAFIAPVAFLVTGACFATRNDVRILQTDVENTRRNLEQRIARGDSALAARMDVLKRTLDTFPDSLRAFENRFWNTGGKLTETQDAVQRAIDTLLRQVESLSREVTDARSELGLLREVVSPLANRAAMDSTGAVMTGPLALLKAANDQLDAGATSTARDLFNEVLTQFSDSMDIAASAQMGIANSYRRDNEVQRADSVWQLVVEKYPRSKEAPTALYSHGLFLHEGGRTAQARAIFERVTREYPGTEAARLALERIRD